MFSGGYGGGFGQLRLNQGPMPYQQGLSLQQRRAMSYGGGNYGTWRPQRMRDEYGRLVTDDNGRPAQGAGVIDFGPYSNSGGAPPRLNRGAWLRGHRNDNISGYLVTADSLYGRKKPWPGMKDPWMDIVRSTEDRLVTGSKCQVCGRHFGNDNALQNHFKAHKDYDWNEYGYSNNNFGNVGWPWYSSV